MPCKVELQSLVHSRHQFELHRKHNHSAAKHETHSHLASQGLFSHLNVSLIYQTKAAALKSHSWIIPPAKHFLTEKRNVKPLVQKLESGGKTTQSWYSLRFICALRALIELYLWVTPFFMHLEIFFGNAKFQCRRRLFFWKTQLAAVGEHWGQWPISIMEPEHARNLQSQSQQLALLWYCF